MDNATVHPSPAVAWLPGIPPDLAPDQVRCMRTLRVWRYRPDDGLVELLAQEATGLSRQALNRTGSLLWTMMEAHPTLAELAGRLADAHGIPMAEALNDTRDFVNTLILKDHVRAVLVHD